MNKIDKEIELRVLEEAYYFIDNHSTVRATAEAFRRPKSTVFLDLTKKLPRYSYSLYLQVRSILSKNKEESSLRGRLAMGKNNPLKNS